MRTGYSVGALCRGVGYDVAARGIVMAKLTPWQAQDQSDSNTPSHAPTPTGSVPTSLSRADSLSGAAGGAPKAGNKKKRPTEKDDEDDGKSVKRGKITYSRD